ncbi:MAG: ATP-binding cassette domain-containing protein [Planctomycetota bacterium]|nr:ATP-binding cassette domain-containing protein [Planctomycetota bacterium]
MPLVSLEKVTIRYRGPALLDDVDCIVEATQRVGLLGRNGAGKSTFLKLIAGMVQPDHGRVVPNPDARIAQLPQIVPQDMQGKVFPLVREGVVALPGQDIDDWEKDHLTEQILSRMDLQPDLQVGAMSAGMKRRVLLARALVQKPDLLLLDEPTNHLDLDSIRWLEDFLDRYDAGYIFITHDRQFLRRLATRILEIDRGQLFDWSCDYETFLKRKEADLAAREKQEKLFDKKLAEEEAWRRQGIKARRTRNEGRVRALKELRKIRSERREQVGTSNLHIQEAMRSGNLILKAQDLHFKYKRDAQTSESASNRSLAAREILGGFGCTVMRGEKIGIVGPNGVGKTTLLRVLLGQLQPDQGSVRLGANLQIAYFDQLRQQLDPDNTIEQEVADGYQTIEMQGGTKHVLGYLQDFLFTPERARTKIQFLSGGEVNRILLAKLFAKPANVIVLDEPTNDLDAETMELLEERLVEFKGTILVVSHDREFLNNVATSIFAFEPRGGAADEFQVLEYVGGYDDWQRQCAERTPAGSSKAKPVESNKKEVSGVGSKADLSPVQKAKPKKLSFKETKELEELPAIIEELETGIQEIHSAMADADFYKQAGDVIAAKQSELQEQETRLSKAYVRWEELESRTD